MTASTHEGYLAAMRLIAELQQVAGPIGGVFTDIDDTLTTDGKLHADAFAALWRLKQAGLLVVVVTGRPAGWCDAIARQWPVDGVIGENGALAFYERHGRLHELWHAEAQVDDAMKRLQAVRDDILRRVPGSRVSKDQPYRRCDLAIDFREEPPDLGFAAAERIAQIFAEHGAQAKVSSIHVNGWFGQYDKLSLTKIFMQEVFGKSLDDERQHYVFCGDSPNDEPMFEYFPLSCGVANIAPFVPQLSYPPAFITKGSGGVGFAELVQCVLSGSKTP